MYIIKSLTIAILALMLALLSNQSAAQLTELDDFGDNPGDLEASYYEPTIKAPALVVLLHGCVQHGDKLAQQSGLLGLAKTHKFALLVPQQSLFNNMKRCFNWYSDDDYSKDVGENLSIKNMIATMKQKLGSEKVYIIGLSGGGAMTSSLLVNYPNLFTAGAVVSGIPFPCADGLITGISCMNNGPSQTTEELVALTKKLNPKQTTWPKLSVWTGAVDGIVNPVNSTALAQQWTQLWSIESQPEITKNEGYTVSEWKNSQQEVAVQLVSVAGLGHGVMVNVNVENGGEVADYLLASPISTAKQVINFWKLN